MKFSSRAAAQLTFTALFCALAVALVAGMSIALGYDVW